MAERGARPRVPEVQRKLLNAARSLTSPLLPDDYLEMINPLWSTRELRGRIERIQRETENAATIYIKPGWEWPGHKAGQYVRIGLDIDGVRHWRAYSLTSEPDDPEGLISITPKVVEEGVVSPYLVRKANPGTLVYLSDVEGQFVLPESTPEKMLFVTAGSGITPVMSMLRDLAHRDELVDVVLLHSARTKEDVIFGEEMRELAEKHDGLRLHEQMTGEMGHLEPRHLDELCPDWRERETFASGPGALLDALTEHYDNEGLCDQFHLERFQPIIGGGEGGEGGTVKFLDSDKEVECEGSQPILVAGEEAGLELPFGCRMGVCHTCVGTLCSGRVRDLRSNEVYGNEGEKIRTCISSAEGDVEIDL